MRSISFVAAATIGGTVMALVTISSASAAGTYTWAISNSKSLGHIGNRDYKNYSYIIVNAPQALANYAQTNVETVHGATVPPGWIETRPSVNYSDGRLCNKASKLANTTTTNKWYSATKGACGAGYIYYAQGTTWEGDNSASVYRQHDTFRTVDLQSAK